MTKSKTLALLAVVAILLTLPAVVLAQAQPPRPAVFGGTATIDGATAADGTTVTAEIDGTEVASAKVSGGNYGFTISQPPDQSFAGKTITFKIGGSTANETATWAADGGGELNLTATTKLPATASAVVATVAPVTPTVVPVTPTVAPVSSTVPAVSPTVPAVSSAVPPVGPTIAPVSTLAPAAATLALIATTPAPGDSTSAPATGAAASMTAAGSSTPSTGKGATESGADEKAEAPPAPTFPNRFVTNPTKSSDMVALKATTDSQTVCVPQNVLKAYGFYYLSGTEGEVNLGLYNRVQYYSLTPGPLGNIPPLTDGKSFTKQAHDHGSKADLVISAWDFNTSGGTVDQSKPKLQFSKSYVLLNMVDEIVAAVELNNFDGVTIDFRLPKKDPASTAAFTFFIKRLNSRLDKDNIKRTSNDLLAKEARQLNVILDGSATLDTSTDELKAFFKETIGSIDLVFVDEADKKEVGKTVKLLRNGSPRPIIATVPDNPEGAEANEAGNDPLGIWDVSGAGSAHWNKALDTQILNGPQTSLKEFVSDNLCTNRDGVLFTLTGAAPFLLILLALSWAFEDFPWIRKKPLGNKLVNQIVLWASLWIVFAAFALLLYGMPSLDIQNIGVYVILATFAVSIVYMILTGLSLLAKRDYP